MKKITLLLLAAMSLQACSKKSTPTASHQTPKPPAPVASPMSEETTDANSANAKAGAADLTAAGKEIFMAKCGSCHGIKEPGLYSRERWVPIMDHMAPKAHLTESEKSMVLMYVQANAKK